MSPGSAWCRRGGAAVIIARPPVAAFRIVTAGRGRENRKREPMLELNEDNVLAYLRERDRLPPGPARARVLGGGVSNIVLGIDTAAGGFVLKQSRPQLRTRDAWFSDLERVYR